MNSFRACDIRGIYPDEVNESLFAGIGAAIARRWARNTTVLLGRDCRTGSRSLQLALASGLQSGGAKPLDAGRIPTPVAYFGKRYLECPVACIVTASHNPAEYHGLKILLPHGPAQPDDIRWLAQESSGFCGPLSSDCECVRIDDAYREFIAARWKHIDRENRPLRVVVDAGNGAWSGLASDYLAGLGIDCRAIHDSADGRFPSRPPDCADPRNLNALRRAVIENQADIGFAWDGDGDRLAVVDDLGQPVSSDQIALLLAPEILAGSIGEKVLLDVKMSRRIAGRIESLGALPVIEKSAHCALEHSMLSHDCIFGCEYSGHFFFRDLHGADDGLVAALRVLECVRGSRPPLSVQLASLPPLFITRDIRIPATLQDFATIDRRLSDAFAGQEIIRLDGLKISFERATVLVRASVSEDKLSMRFEGDSAADLTETIHLLLDLLPEWRCELEAQLMDHISMAAGASDPRYSPNLLKKSE